MTPELASSYDEATELTTFRLFTCTLWGIVATFVHSVLYKSFPSESNPEVLDYQKGKQTSCSSFDFPNLGILLTGIKFKAII
mgnify:CR=1 FL=1